MGHIRAGHFFHEVAQFQRSFAHLDRVINGKDGKPLQILLCKERLEAFLLFQVDKPILKIRGRGSQDCPKRLLDRMYVSGLSLLFQLSKGPKKGGKILEVRALRQVQEGLIFFKGRLLVVRRDDLSHEKSEAARGERTSLKDLRLYFREGKRILCSSFEGKGHDDEGSRQERSAEIRHVAPTMESPIPVTQD